MSLNPFVPDEDAYALGFAEMPDLQLDPQNGGLAQRLPLDCPENANRTLAGLLQTGNEGMAKVEGVGL